MGHPMVMHLKHNMDHVIVFSFRPRCDWPDCFSLARWEVEARRYWPGLDLPGDHFCTAHARAVIRKIEQAAEHARRPPAAAPDARGEGGE